MKCCVRLRSRMIRLRLAVSDKAADRMTAYRSGLGNVQVAYSRMFDGLK